MTADETPEALRRRIDELEALLTAQHTTVSGGYVGEVIAHQENRQTIGVNQGTVQLFFGAKPPADAKALLDSYLRGLVAEHGYLRLGKLLDRERSGRDQAVMPEIALLEVYISLTTDRLLPAGAFTLSSDALRAAMDSADPSKVLPDAVRVPIVDQPGRAPAEPRPLALGERTITEIWRGVRRDLRERGPARSGQWYSPEPLISALCADPQGRLVLLGSPGSGKSTGLRHLTVSLATDLLGGARTLSIPFFCPLGPLALELTRDPRRDVEALINAVLRPALGAGGMRAGLREQLIAAIAGGSALLFFDGLDEVSGTPEPTLAGMRSRRERVADAIRSFARQVGMATVVVTCRTRPYEQDAAWQLREGWAVRRLQPFAFGQVRHFITRWYAATCADGQGRYTPAEAAARAERLGALLEHPERAMLRDLATSPLLLTMLALLGYNNTRMPERRASVYEELVKLLLDRWEGVRSSEKDQRGQRIGERLGLPYLTIEDLRPALHELAFQAHGQSADGRGVLPGALLRETLDTFFARKINPLRPKEAMAEAAQPRERLMKLLLEESGLLLEEADETYVFPHLTFEEYLAACHLAGRDSQGMQLAYQQWAQGGERWREVVRLMLGRLQQQEKYDNLLGWLQRLAPRRQGASPSLQRQRDALLAADCYATIEGRRAFAATHHDLEAFEADLRGALLAVLARPDPALPLSERVEAGDALGALGDPRFPVADAQWAAELARRNEAFGQPTGYLCYVPGGRYRIGGWPEGTKGHGDKGTQGYAGVSVTLQPFWVAKFPITIAQYAPFVAEGYGPHAERWWAPEVWAWKQADRRKAPVFWDRPGYCGLNQPVVTVTWHEATAYCAWLTERMAAALPAGYVVRLPTEAEWEAAAAYDGTGRRHTYPWGEAEPTPDLAIYGESRLGRPAPVGCCPRGAAACGALDLAGNVWELAASAYDAYPDRSHLGRKHVTSGPVPWRGASWREGSPYVRSGVRGWGLALNVGFNGFRCVVAPPLD